MNVGIDFVKPGMIVMEDINFESSKNGYLVRNGYMLTDTIISRLKEKNIEYVKIKTKADVKMNETVGDEVRNIVIKSLKNFDYANIRDIIKSSTELSNSITESNSFNFDLTRYFISNNDVYEHSLNVAQFACALCKVYNKFHPENQVKIEEVSMAAILHDIGKEEISEFDLKKIGKDVGNLNADYFPGYSDEYFERYDESNFPIYDFAIIKDNPQIPSSVKVALLLQRENFSKQIPGPLHASETYLQEQSKKTAYTMSKIIHICDIYEYLIKKSLTLNESVSNVIEIMNTYKENGGIDPEMLKLLFFSIPLYGVGTKVILSGNISNNGITIDLNDKEAVVVDYDYKNPTRPVINVSGINIPLMKCNTLTIKKIAPINYEEIFEIENSENSVNKGRSL